MKKYDLLIEKLFSLNSGLKTKESLLETEKMAALLGDPQYHYPTIHIAGTNGKGSVAFKIATALYLAGYRVGLYSSPHLFSYRERIRVNEEMISKEEVVAGLEKLFELSTQPRFFELTTLLAFMHFSTKNIDIAIIETGLGGRLDTTNIVSPILSIITTIDFDHQEVLGNTLNAIAFEKGGIIKEKTPVLFGQKANFPILREIAYEKKAPIYFTEKKENEEIASKALDIICSQFPVDSKFKIEALSKNPPFRFEVRGNIVLDVAHNPSAFKRLFAQVKERFSDVSVSLLLALSKEKHPSLFIETLKEHVEETVLFHSSHLRLRNPLEIVKEFEKGGYHCWSVHKTAFTSLKYLLFREERQRRIVVVAGSFYMMKEVLGYSFFKSSTS